ncbi:hypothetical protein [Shimia sp.]|uniref:hypothetical protein n=1 Tax=Shimia sp. TaxID=1954381 RepID=UPI0032976F47
MEAKVAAATITTARKLFNTEEIAILGLVLFIFYFVLIPNRGGFGSNSFLAMPKKLPGRGRGERHAQALAVSVCVFSPHGV